MRQGSEVLHQVDDLIAAAQLPAVTRAGSDWVWRPRLWLMSESAEHSILTSGSLRIGGEIALFSDGKDREVIARQTRHSLPGDTASYGLRVEFYDLTGSYVSVVLDLPPSAVRGLSQKHSLTVDILLTAEADVQCYAALNIESGPNKERLVHGFRPSDRLQSLTFDLSQVAFDAARVERLWLEVVFDPSPMNALQIDDLTLYRTLRREL
jgi:hypothetical protein